MILSVQKLVFFPKHSSKLENHHHHHHHPSEAFSASLQAFHSDVSNCLSKLSPNSDLGSEFLSLVWLQQCFEQLPIVNKAFSKLVVEIDYPISKWEVSSIEDYLNYSLNLLEFVNSISSAISQLNQTRVSVSHALSIIENSPEKLKRLKEIRLKDCKDLRIKGIGESKQKISTEKGFVLHQALLVLKSTGLWVSSVLLSGLCSDVKPYMDIRQSAGGFILPTLNALDSSVCKEMMENRGIVKEFREINESVDYLISAMANGKTVADSAKELKRRLEVIEKVLKGIGEAANQLFSEVMAGRNELLDILRQKMQ